MLPGMLVPRVQVAHAAKPWSLHYKWTALITEEFCLQGDLERSLRLPVSPLGKRETLNLPKAQCGFIEWVVGPILRPFCNFNKLTEPIKRLEENYATWKSISLTAHLRRDALALPIHNLGEEGVSRQVGGGHDGT